ncbi:MAG TPA: hypothetical protein VFW80_02570 [Gaiellaceae bacterium]|nr:hypothetical protein [Gaiellaceae bacterium]
MAVPVRDAPGLTVPPSSPLDDVLRRINQIRVARGADAIYELPSACTAWEGGGCVLERAFEDLGVLVVDYTRAYGRRLEFEHGLGDFVRDFDAGRHPGLLAGR